LLADSGRPAEAIPHFQEALRVKPDYADACPIATVALEVASTSEPLREATADVFAFLASDDAAFITGETIVIDGGQLAD